MPAWVDCSLEWQCSGVFEETSISGEANGIAVRMMALRIGARVAYLQISNLLHEEGALLIRVDLQALALGLAGRAAHGLVVAGAPCAPWGRRQRGHAWRRARFAAGWACTEKAPWSAERYAAGRSKPNFAHGLFLSLALLGGAARAWA